METKIWCPPVPAPAGRRLNKETMVFANTSDLEKTAPLALTLKLDN